MAKQPFGIQPPLDGVGLARALWAPAAGSHAIVKTSAIVSFSENVTSLTIKRMSDAIRETARQHGMTTEGPINLVTFEVSPGAAPKSSSQDTGISFQDIRGTASVQSLTISPEAIRFETQAYTRWVAFYGQIDTYLQTLLPIIAHVTGVKSVALEYIDLFVSRREGPADASLIIERKSDYISRRAFKKTDPFHVHTGWFDNCTEDTRLLVNVDISAADAQGPEGVRRAISVRTHEAEQVLDPLGDKATSWTDPKVVSAILTILHERLKKHLGQILTRDAQAMISLGN